MRAPGLKKLEDRVVDRFPPSSSSNKVDIKVEARVVASINNKVATKVEYRVATKVEDRLVDSVPLNSTNKKVAIKVEEEVGDRNREGMVAVGVVELHVSQWPLNSHMVDNLITISWDEGPSSINNEGVDHSSNMVA